MAIVEKCKNCKRKGGYAKNSTQDNCQRCVNLLERKESNKQKPRG